ncbi:MAG: regulatory protein RecX [Candidatus Omnitrophica bacterium]|nr:regulatory protein RecX [Candidatus Omnitrophota bacterium]
MKKKSNSIEQARNYAFLLLKFRLRSENELYQRLVKKGFSIEVAKEVVNFLREKRFIDDKLFAKAWVDSRIKKPFGVRRIKQELLRKGMAQEVIDKQLAQIKENYSEIDVVRQISEERFKKLSGVTPEAAKRRVYGYLLRRGFSPEVILEVL